jgi:hypothetical protein
VELRAKVKFTPSQVHHSSGLSCAHFWYIKVNFHHFNFNFLLLLALLVVGLARFLLGICPAGEEALLSICVKKVKHIENTAQSLTDTICGCGSTAQMMINQSSFKFVTKSNSTAFKKVE